MRLTARLICLALFSLAFDALAHEDGYESGRTVALESLDFRQDFADEGVPDLKLTSRLSPPHVWHSDPGLTANPDDEAVSMDEDVDDVAVDTQVETAVLAAAESMVGTRYHLGSDSESALDCSAFVRRVFSMVGFSLPRSTREMIQIGEQIEESELVPGDLMFYRFHRRLHVALYAGNGDIVHASPSARQVVRVHLTEDWNRRLVSVRRLI